MQSETVVEYYSGKTLKQLVEDNIDPLKLPYVRVYLDGSVIDKSYWGKIKPKERARVFIAVVAQGGGGGGGKNPLAMIASIAIMIAAPYAAAAMMGGTVSALTGTIGFSLLTGAVSAIGMLAVSALFPPPAINTGTGASQSASPPTYSFNSLQNQARAYQSVKRLYGEFNYAPDVAVATYTRNFGDTQYLYAVYDFGEGEYSVSDLKIGGNPISNYDSVEYRVREGYTDQPLELYGNSDVSVESLSIKLARNDPIIITSAMDAVSVSLNVNFPQGLTAFNDRGSRVAHSESFSVQIRRVGDVDWLSPTSATTYGGGTSLSSQGGVSPDAQKVLNRLSPSEIAYAASASKTVTYNYPGTSATYQETNDKLVELAVKAGILTEEEAYPVKAFYGEGINSYSQLATSQASFVNDTCTHHLNGTAALTATGFTVRRATSSGFSSGIEIKTYPGQYEVKIERLTDDSTSTKVLDDAFLSQVTTMSSSKPLSFDKPHTILEFKAKATDQFNGAVDTLTARCRAKIDYWNGTGWSNGFTDNPSHIVMDMLRGAKLPIPDSRIDFDAFHDWAQHCAEAIEIQTPGGQISMRRGATNCVFDSKSTLKQAVDSVCSNGFATIAVIDGKYKPIIDRKESFSKQLFTPRNSWGFKGSKEFKKLPHALRVKFVDSQVDWQVKDVPVYLNGYNFGNSTNFEDVETFGLIAPEQAYLFGKYMIAQGEFRQESFKLSVDIENLICTRGDIVSVQHDVGMVGGVSARVKSIAGDIVEIDESISLDIASKSYALYVRRQDGTQSMLTIDSQLSDKYLEISGVSGMAEGDLIVVGETGTVIDKFRISSVRPMSDMTAELTMIPYREDFYDFESGISSEYVPQISLFEGSSPQNVVNVTSEFSHYDNAGGVSVNYSAYWEPQTLVAGYRILVDKGDGFYQHSVSTDAKFNGTVPYGIGVDSFSIKIIPYYANGKSLAVSEAQEHVLTLPSLPVGSVTSLIVESGAEHLRLNADGSINTRALISIAREEQVGFAGYDIQYRMLTEDVWSSKLASSDTLYLENLISGEDCYIRARIRTVDEGNPGQWFEVTHSVVGKSEPPADVLNLSATLNSGVYTLSWSASPELDFKNYIVMEDGLEIDRVTSNSYVLSKISNGIFSYQVFAVDTSGNLSLNSTEVQVDARIAAPASLSANSGTSHLVKNTDGSIDSRILVSWSSVENAVSYALRYKSANAADSKFVYTVVDADSSSAYLSGLADLRSYSIQVRAISPINGVKSEWATVNHLNIGKSEPPTNVSQLQSEFKNGRYTLYWNKVEDLDVSEYVLYKESVEYARTSSNFATLSNIENGSNTYGVRAIDSYGNVSVLETSISIEVSIDAPTITSISSDESLLSVKADGSIITRMKVDWNSVSNASKYIVRYKEDNLTSIWQELVTFDTYKIIEGLVDEADYLIEVIAVGDVESVRATSLQSSHRVIGKTTPPSVPVNLQATLNSGTYILSWDQASEVDVIGYQIRKDGTLVDTVAGNMFICANLENGVNEYSVRAIDAARLSSMDATVSIDASIATPSALSVESGTSMLTVNKDGSINTRAKITWSEISNAKEYAFRYKPTNELSYTETRTTSPSIVIDSLSDGTIYDMEVKALSAIDGVSSAFATTTHLAIGKTEAPDAVTGLTATLSNGVYTLRWNAVNAPDMSHYKITGGASGETIKVYGNSYDTTDLVNGLNSYDVTSVDTTGNESVPASIVIDATIVAPTLTGVNSGTDMLVLNQDGTINARAKVSWSPVSNAKSYKFRYKRAVDPTYSVTIDTDTTTTIVEMLKDGELYNFELQSVSEIAGITSDWVSFSSIAEGKTAAPTAVSNFSVQIKDRNLVFEWDAVPDIDVRSYEIRKGDTFDSGTFVALVDSTSYVQEAIQAGSYKWWIKSYDTTEHYSLLAAETSINILPPGKPNVSAQIIDNNVLLKFDANEGTLAIAKYRVLKDSELVGETPGNFSVIFEASGGLYQYDVVAIDIAGNESIVGSTTANVSEPPDYILNALYQFDFSDTFVNSSPVDGSLTMPVDTAETWGDYVANGYTTIQSEIDAQNEGWLTPHNNQPASYTETYDYGTVLPSTLVTISATQLRSSIQGGTVSVKIESSLDAVSWDVYQDLWQVYLTGFRYTRVTITVTPVAEYEQIVYSKIEEKLDSKIRNDAGAGTIVTASTGATVPFNVDFVDVVAITPNAKAGGTAVTAIYDFTDVPNPTDFTVFLLDSNGNKTTGEFSWSARGY